MTGGNITLFGDKHPPAPAEHGVDMQTIFRRLKMVEEGLTNMRRQQQLNEQNTIAITKRVNEQLAVFERDIASMKGSVEKIKDDVRMIIAELQACAKSEDVAVIKKYVEMLNPIHFVTQDEIEHIINDKLRTALR